MARFDEHWNRGRGHGDVPHELHTQFSLNHYGGDFVAGGGLSYAVESGIDRARSTTTEFVESIGASIGIGVGAKFGDVSARLDRSITSGASSTYSFGVSETQTATIEFGLPRDGVIRPAGYATMEINHSIAGQGGAGLTDRPLVIFQWDLSDPHA